MRTTTTSRESAPRSSVKEVSPVTVSSSTMNCSATILITFSLTMIILLHWL